MSPDRLSVIDEIFLRTHRGFGLPNVMQGIWRSSERIDRVELAAVHANLAVGSLGRRVITPRIPGARRRWAASTVSLPLDITRIDDERIRSWADSRAEVDLDPEFGPGWRMSAAEMDGGGTAISVVCSHALADAANLISAVGKAFEGTAPQQHLLRRSPEVSGVADVADAVSLAFRVAAGSIRAVGGLILRREARREMRAYLRSSKSIPTHEAHISTAVFEIDVALTNSEFISLVTEIAVDLGETMPVSVNIPFRSKTPGANEISMATIDVSVGDSLAHIKEACKAAFSRPAGAPSGFPAETVQLLSDKAAASLTASPGAARVLCSNIGALPDSIAVIGNHSASALVTRALHPAPHTTAEHSQTTTALSSYLSTLNGRSTLALVATEARFAEILTERAAAVLTRRGLPARSWK